MATSTTQPTILVPLDGSDFAEQALPLAISLARSTNRHLQLLLVQEVPLWPDENGAPDLGMIKRILHADGEAYLRSAERRFMSPGLAITSIALSAEMRTVGEVLSGYVQDAGVELVVMASHGRGGVKRAWLGSVADYLLRHVNVPVIITRPGCIPDPQSNRILVPLDGSPLAETVLDDVCRIAGAGNHDITLLQVVQPVMRTLSAPEAPYVEFDAKLTGLLRDAAEDYLEDLEEVVRDRGIKCSSLTLVAHNTAEAILEVARPAHFTMVAMATHGVGGVRRMLLGSCADKVIRGAEVPVLVYRPLRSGVRVGRKKKLAGPTTCAL